MAVDWSGGARDEWNWWGQVVGAQALIEDGRYPLLANL